MNKILTSLHVIILVLAAGCVPATADPQADSSSVTSLPASTGLVSPIVVIENTAATTSYPIVDTSQGKCYDNNVEVACPAEGQSFFGQDAQYSGNTARYQDNRDGTVTDLVTGLMWQQDPGPKMTYEQAMTGASSFNLAGYNDWRLPTIKELYSLILFDGTDVSGCTGACAATPFIDTRTFNFQYGDTASGERIIDSQFASSTLYVSNSANDGGQTLFGVNFADGRIKGYGLTLHGQQKTFFVLYVRGNLNYGQNSYADNGNDTVTDNATGLMWMKFDSGAGMNWEAALNYCESSSIAGHNDWRLPNVKELQSIVDYSRSPDTMNSAAIDPVFSATSISNEAGQGDFPFYWSSTTHTDSSGRGTFAAYVAFGRAPGYMNSWVDVHGAGAQRSDPKTGAALQFPQGNGPQGDAIRINNYVRCVRGGDGVSTPDGSPSEARPTIPIESSGINLNQSSGPGQEPGPLGGTPPLEAVNACSGLIEGAACAFTTPNGTVNGMCQLIQSQLACVPPMSP